MCLPSSSGNLLPRPSEVMPTAQPCAPSISTRQLELGRTCEPRSQEASATGVPGQPSAVQSGQPITHRVASPPPCQRPITDAGCGGLTKDSPGPGDTKPVIPPSPGGEIKEVQPQEVGDVQSEAEIQEMEAETEGGEDDSCRKTQKDDSERTFTVGTASQQLPLAEKSVEEEQEEEQTEPLDLSLPRRRRSGDRKCSRFLDESGGESLLIMEVDEYEGEGDRDVVEEDDDDDGDDDDDDGDEDHRWAKDMAPMDALEGPSPPSSPSSMLLIDDEGIPYTLGPDGLKVPQVDPTLAEAPPLESVEVGGQRSPGPDRPEDTSQKVEEEPLTPSDDLEPPSTAPVQPPQTALASTDLSGSPASPQVQPVNTGPLLPCSTPSSSSSSSSILPQPIQILTRPPTNTPILLLSSSTSSSSPPPLSSAPLGLTLPLSVPHTSPPLSSAPVLLLLSSVPPPSSSSGKPAPNPAPFAVLDPSTGHLAQITAAPPPLTLPQTPLTLPALSHPVIRLSPNNPPVILPGVKSVSSSSLLPSIVTSSSSPPAAAAPLLRCAQISCAQSEFKAIKSEDAEQVSAEDHKPLSPAACDQVAQPNPEAPPPTSEPPSESCDPCDPRNLHTQHLPLDDHLYFSSAVAPPSPPAKLRPLEPLEPLEPLDPLDPRSPLASPTSAGPRRVLYCQLCPRVFFYLSDLERHAITHSQKKPHVCQQCGKAFKRSSHLQVSAIEQVPLGRLTGAGGSMFTSLINLLVPASIVSHVNGSLWSVSRVLVLLNLPVNYGYLDTLYTFVFLAVFLSMPASTLKVLTCQERICLILQPIGRHRKTPNLRRIFAWCG